MSDKLHLEVVTPLGVIFSADVKSVVMPGKNGEFGVLKGHATSIVLLKEGVVDIENSNGEHELIAINSGHAKVDELGVVVLAQGAVYVGGNTESEVSKNLEKIKEMLKSVSSDTATLTAAFSKLDASGRF